MYRLITVAILALIGTTSGETQAYELWNYKKEM